jgi:hypothetical protein
MRCYSFLSWADRCFFYRLRSVHMGLSSGARSPGLATVKGIFGYLGKPFQRFEGGAWVTTYGTEGIGYTRNRAVNPYRSVRCRLFGAAK